jgi:aminoglycoside phosphotransferase (APT) family kinase protein
MEPFSQSCAQWFVDNTRWWLKLTREQGFVTPDDEAWAEQVIAQATSALAVPFRPTFVMSDYNLGNVLVQCTEGEWRVSGVVDFEDYYFGDGEADLVRPIAAYLDLEKHRDTRLAQAFAGAYVANRPSRPGFAERYALSMVRDRLQVWEYVKRNKFDHLLLEPGAFREWAQRYVLSYRIFDSRRGN